MDNIYTIVMMDSGTPIRIVYPVEETSVLEFHNEAGRAAEAVGRNIAMTRRMFVSAEVAGRGGSEGHVLEQRRDAARVGSEGAGHVRAGGRSEQEHGSEEGSAGRKGPNVAEDTVALCALRQRRGGAL